MKQTFTRVIGCALASVMVFSAAGCNGNVPSETTSDTGSSTESETAEETSKETKELWTMPPVQSTITADGSILKNGFFDDEDVSMWSIECGSSAISSGNSELEAHELYPNYGVIDRDPSRSSPYD